MTSHYDNNNNNTTIRDVSWNKLLLLLCKNYKLQILKNLDVIEKKRLQIANHLKRIVVDAPILARK